MRRPLMRRADLLLISALICGIVWSVLFALSRPAGDTVRVTQDGAVIAELPLSQPAELNAGEVKIVISDSQAYIAESDCGDKLCVRTGRLKKAGDTAVCLPNRVIVSVVGGGKQPDGVTY
jgi:hypothetical protein